MSVTELGGYGFDLASIEATPSVGEWDSNSNVWKIGTLQPGVQLQLVIRIKISDTYDGVSEAVNRVTIESPEHAVPGMDIQNDTVLQDTDQSDNVILQPTLPIPPLARTGVELTVWLVWSVLFLVVGAGIILVRRRRIVRM